MNETIYEALWDDVMALGGAKKVGPMLWPDMPDSAGRLRGCLSPKHAQKLDPEEVFKIKEFARAIGSSAMIDFEAQHLRFKYEWISAEDAKAELQRQFIEAMRIADSLSKRLSR